MKRVYLSGPITGRSYTACTSWRAEAARYLAPELLAVDPMRGKDFLQGSTQIDAFTAGPQQAVSSTAITARDRHDVMTCDAVLVNLIGADRVSIGSMIEIGWADAFRKPIVLAIDRTDHIHVHPIILGCCAFVVSDLQTAVATIRSLLT